MDNTIVREPGIVDNDVNLAAAKLGRLLHELLEVVVLEEVAGDREGLAAGAVDGLGYGLDLGGVNV